MGNATSQPTKWRSKTEFIDAMRYDGTPESRAAIREWLGFEPKEDNEDGDTWVHIDTYGGLLYVGNGDYVLKGDDGQSDLCDSDLFMEMYELNITPEQAPVTVEKTVQELVELLPLSWWHNHLCRCDDEAPEDPEAYMSSGCRQQYKGAFKSREHLALKLHSALYPCVQDSEEVLS